MARMNAVNPRVSFAELQTWPEPERSVRYELYDERWSWWRCRSPGISESLMAATRVRPDLAVEVLSRSTEARDRGRKMAMLARYGVPEYWIVDPVRNTLEIHAIGDRKYALYGVCGETDEVRSPTLPELSFNASAIFEE